MSKKALHDQLIADIAALTITGGAVAFDNVGKIFYKNMQPRDAEVSPTGTGAVIEGVDVDTRAYDFMLLTHEELDSADGVATLENKIDRLSFVEDAVFDYLQAVPVGLSSNLDGAVAGLTIYRIGVNPASYTEIEYETGIIKQLRINFRVFVLINPRSL